jgi:regulatory protein
VDEHTRQAYVAGLKMLARRELSERQVRARLARREFDPDHIDAAVERLRQDRALDDRRVALACARTEAGVRRRGRARVLRHVEALGIARDVARAAVNEVFAEIDESALLEQALDARLRRGVTLDDDAGVRRLHRYLIAQGFDPSHVIALLQSRLKHPESRLR